MINIKNKNCQYNKCKETPLYGLPNKKIQYCFKHKKLDMVNLILENKCSILDCDKDHEIIVDNIKYCTEHLPDKNMLNGVKRLCKYCDILEDCKYVCKDCQKIQNKKEWAIVRHLRKTIDTQFEYNSSKMLQGCSKKRPDIFFELLTHCLIVEIDEHQHNSYGDSCECARINEIVNGIGGKPVIIIRYNPDTIKNKGKVINFKQEDKIKTLECEYCHKDFKIQITLTRHYMTCKAKVQQELNNDINIKAQYEKLKTENPDKIKEYNKRANQKRKDKKLLEIKHKNAIPLQILDGILLKVQECYKKYKETHMLTATENILTWTNKQCDEYNNEIRKILFKSNEKDQQDKIDTFANGDVLMLNDFYSMKQDKDDSNKFYTSEQIKVIELELVEKQIGTFPTTLSKKSQKLENLEKYEEFYKKTFFS